MSYTTVHQCAQDAALNARLTAAIAEEQRAKGDTTDPGALVGTLVWSVAAAPDIEAAYASALAGGNPDPGGDESVITDQMILSAVQASWPT